jgi:hypothetical protein
MFILVTLIIVKRPTAVEYTLQDQQMVACIGVFCQKPWLRLPSRNQALFIASIHPGFSHRIFFRAIFMQKQQITVIHLHTTVYIIHQQVSTIPLQKREAGLFVILLRMATLFTFYCSQPEWQ